VVAGTKYGKNGGAAVVGAAVVVAAVVGAEVVVVQGVDEHSP
jgi:hypothetical protein